jgi:cytochrome b
MNEQNTNNPPKRVFVKVWDPIVRIGHWTMVLSFCALYFRGDKFPLHVYAAYIVMAIMLFRVIWGFVGPHAARFWTFLYSPKTMIQYGIDSVVGHPMHTISHNPLGGAMVFGLIITMLGTGVLGMMLYSSGQEMGLLGDMVPSEWEDEFTTLTLFGQTFPIGLKDLHIFMGNVAASLVTCHVLGTVWATAVHKTNHVIGMITGVKDAYATDPELKYYKQVPAPNFARNLHESVGPAFGEIVLVAGILICLVWPVVEFLTWLNKFIPSY